MQLLVFDHDNAIFFELPEECGVGLLLLVGIDHINVFESAS